MIFKRLTLALLAMLAIATGALAQEGYISAVYKGIKGYGVTDKNSNKETFRFDFYLDDDIKSFSISDDGGKYTLQNRLMEGYRYMIKPSHLNTALDDVELEAPIAEGTVTGIYDDAIEIDNIKYTLSSDAVYSHIEMKAGGATLKKISGVKCSDRVKAYGNPVKYVDRTFVPTPFTPAVNATPGKRTLKNFLQTAMMPLGNVLYVYGGSWNWQDTGAGPQATTIGVPDSWISFFQMNDKSYRYKIENPSKSYYPWHKYNEYYYAGADCSGYVGWTIYNTMETESGKDGYVMSATKMAKTFSRPEYGFGTYTTDNDLRHFRPGDIVSIGGHVYICIGVCSDNSMVIAHSTPAGPGSGIQLSAVAPTANCEALKLAKRYMTRYCHDWTTVHGYTAEWKSSASYLKFSSPNTGRMSWHISSTGLEDPDGLADMTAEEILPILFDE